MATEHLTPFDQLAELFESVAVPVIFAPEAELLLENAALRPGEDVLDVACGTGIVARLAAPRLRSGGKEGKVVGLDLNEAMLRVAGKSNLPASAAKIEWVQGNAQALPFPNEAFDAVLCQNGLQFFPNKPLAIREMRRVLRPERRLVLSVTGHEPITQTIEPFVTKALGAEAEVMFKEPFSLSDPTMLAGLFDDAGFRSVDISRQSVMTRSSSVKSFLAFTLDVRMARFMDKLSPEEKEALYRNILASLIPFRKGDGADSSGDFPIEFSIEMLVVLART